MRDTSISRAYARSFNGGCNKREADKKKQFSKDQYQILLDFLDEDPRNNVTVELSNVEGSTRAWVYNYDLMTGASVYPDNFTMPDLKQIKREKDQLLFDELKERLSA